MMRLLALMVLIAVSLLAGCAIPGDVPSPNATPTAPQATTVPAISAPTSTATIPPAPPTAPAPTVAPTPTAALTPTAIANDLRGYLATFSDGYMFVEWTENSGSLSGTIQSAGPKSKTGYGIATSSAGFTGIRADNRVTLTIPAGLGFATTLSGTVDGPTLTLFIPNQQGVTTPYTFRAATLTDYNRAVETLKQDDAQRAAQARAAQATADAQNQAAQATASAQSKQQAAVRDANATLTTALRRLSDDSDRLKRDAKYDGVLKTYNDNWTRMQADYQKVTDGAAKKPLSCVQLSQVQVNFGQAEVAYGSIEVARGSFDVVQSVVTSDLKTVRADIQEVQRAFSALQRTVAANTIGSPAAQYSAADVDKAVSAANEVIAIASDAATQAQNQAASIDSKAAQLLKTGREFVATLKCTN